MYVLCRGYPERGYREGRALQASVTALYLKLHVLTGLFWRSATTQPRFHFDIDR